MISPYQPILDTQIQIQFSVIIVLLITFSIKIKFSSKHKNVCNNLLLWLLVRAIPTACHKWYSAIRNFPRNFDNGVWWVSYQKLNRHCKWFVHVLCEKAPTPMRSTWILFHFLQLLTAFRMYASIKRLFWYVFKIIGNSECVFT